MPKLSKTAQSVLLAAAIVVPNVIAALIQYKGMNLLYCLGAAAGNATLVFLFFLLAKTFLVRTRIRRSRRWMILPLSVLIAYGAYILCVLYVFEPNA